MEKYENDDTINIYKEYSNQLNKFYNTNSIYILNKIDCIPKKDKKKIKIKITILIILKSF